MTRAVGRAVQAGRFETNVHEHGDGAPVLLLHGSGPGVSAWENWHGVLTRLGEGRRIVAPDIVGFGFTKYEGVEDLDIKAWTKHIIDLLDALEIERAVLVGNSFGGGLSLALALRWPERVAGLVLMGTPAGEFEQSDALAQAGVFEPSKEAMRRLLLTFPYDQKLVTDEMVAARYETSLRHQDTPFFKKLMAALNSTEGKRVMRGTPLDLLARIHQPTLVLHGREDRVIPSDVAIRIHRAIANADLQLFSSCGHWVQLERPDQFVRAVNGFLDDLAWGRS